MSSGPKPIDNENSIIIDENSIEHDTVVRCFNYLQKENMKIDNLC